MYEVFWQKNGNIVRDLDGTLMRQLAEPIKSGNPRAMAFAEKVAQVWMKLGTETSVWNALRLYENMARKGRVSDAAIAAVKQERYHPSFYMTNCLAEDIIEDWKASGLLR